MSDYEFFNVEPSGGIATVTLNRPPLNVMHNPMMAEFDAALESVVADSDLAAIVIRVECKAFSAGADVGDHAADVSWRAFVTLCWRPIGLNPVSRKCRSACFRRWRLVFFRRRLGSRRQLK